MMLGIITLFRFCIAYEFVKAFIKLRPFLAYCLSSVYVNPTFMQFIFLQIFSDYSRHSGIWIISLIFLLCCKIDKISVIIV